MNEPHMLFFVMEYLRLFYFFFSVSFYYSIFLLLPYDSVILSHINNLVFYSFRFYFIFFFKFFHRFCLSCIRGIYVRRLLDVFSYVGAVMVRIHPLLHVITVDQSHWSTIAKHPSLTILLRSHCIFLFDERNSFAASLSVCLLLCPL